MDDLVGWELVGGPLDGQRIALPDGLREYRIALNAGPGYCGVDAGIPMRAGIRHGLYLASTQAEIEARSLSWKGEQVTG
jgi:hypothetical protein